MTNNFDVKMDEYLPLRDVVFKTLRQAILKGELEPGERLMEIQLAERLGVSRTPIREAIRKLELEGLVLMIPRKGAEVARISGGGSGLPEDDGGRAGGAEKNTGIVCPGHPGGRRHADRPDR